MAFTTEEDTFRKLKKIQYNEMNTMVWDLWNTVTTYHEYTSRLPSLLTKNNWTQDEFTEARTCAHEQMKKTPSTN